MRADGLQDATSDVLALTIGERMEPAGGPSNDGNLSAAVPLVGPHRASLVVTCSADFAKALAAAMFDMSSSDLSAEDIADALGEFTNMIGGSVKTLLEGEWRLGLPEVQEGDADNLPLPSTEPQCTTQIDHQGHPVGLHFYSAEAHGRADAARKDQG